MIDDSFEQDGWNGGYLSLFNNGIEVHQIRGMGPASSETVCLESGYDVSLTYTSGNWEEENAPYGVGFVCLEDVVKE